MFYRDGRWKEFGLEEGTIFPFWLFCIVWAIASYMLSWLVFGSVVLSMPHMPHMPSLREAFGQEESHAVEPLPVPRRNARAQAPEEATTMKPGYYRLNANATQKTGVPKYIYVGPEEPEE
jgi:hypothetical protein